MESDGFAVSAFWRVRAEGLTRSVQSVAGRDQTQQPSRFLRVSCALLWSRPPGGDCKDRGGRGGGRGRTHWRGGETGCLPERCRAPQDGDKGSMLLKLKVLGSNIPSLKPFFHPPHSKPAIPICSSPG